MSEIVVAAIDIGTTCSGYAFSFKHEFEKDPLRLSIKNWTGCNVVFSKTPSCVLIRPDGRTLDSFGYEAENKYAELALDGDHKQWYFFQRFQTTLFNRIGIERNLLLEDSSGKKLPAKKVLALTIQFLKNDLCQALEHRIPGEIKASDIHWVLTVPASLNVAAQQFLREAADDAGIPGQNLSIVSDTQAASAFCTFLQPEKCVGRDKTSFAYLKIGAKFIVLDAGVHEILSENKHREVLSSRIDCGSTDVDEAFEEFLGEIFGKSFISSLKDLFNEDCVDLFREFEIKKRTIRCNVEVETFVRIPGNIIELVANTNDKSISDCVERSRYKNSVSMIRIDAQVMRSFYENVVTDIIRHVETLLKDPIASDCSAIVMVGGLSESNVLQESIQKKFSGLKVIIPDEAGLKGAVILGHNQLTLEVEKTGTVSVDKHVRMCKKKDVDLAKITAHAREIYFRKDFLPS